MNRRTFLQSAGLGAAAWLADIRLVGAADAWKEVDLVVEMRNSDSGPAELWLPVPSDRASYQKVEDLGWSGNYARAELVRDPVYGARAFYAVWPGGLKECRLSQRVRIRDRVGAEPAKAGERELFLKATEHVQTDGIVAETARNIVGREKSDDRKARLIYDWVVNQTVRDPKIRGCGVGDVKGLLASGDLRGKCADLNSLFVGLCRASGVAAREVFGIRVLPSKLSRSLGKSGEVSGAQHCRAEFLSSAKGGWVAADPADVRKVMIEENFDLFDPHIRSLREKLFGSWEGNWIAYNSARDFSLPRAAGMKLNYLMYPFLRAGPKLIDGREPEKMKYTIAAKSG